MEQSTLVPAVQTSQKKRKKLREENLVGYIFLSPWLIGFFAFTVIPMVASLYLAFTKYDGVRPPEWVGLGNFIKMFTDDPRYYKSIQATLYYTFVAVPLRLAIALLLALALNNDRRGTSFHRTVFYIPSIVGGSIGVAVMWKGIFGNEGLVNFILAGLGIPTVAWLTDPRTAIWILILLAIWQFGSPMLIFLAGLKNIPRELYEAAEIDGAGTTARFWYVTIPLLTPVIFFNLVMQLIGGFMVFTQAFVITGGAPLDTTLFYNLYLYTRGFNNFQFGYASAMAWVLLVIVAIATALTFKSSQYWVFYEDQGREKR